MRPFRAYFLLALIAFLIPIEHQYDKLFRFYSLTLAPAGLSISPAYNQKIFFHLSDLLALFFILPVKRFFLNPLWLIFLIACASIVASPFISYPIAYTRLIPLATPLILFSYILCNQDKKEAITRSLFFGLIAAGLLQAFIAITQYFYQEPLGLRFLNEARQMPSTITCASQTRWIFDSPFYLATTKLSRAYGTLPHPNILGGLLVITLACVHFLYTTTKNRYLLLTIPLLTFALFTTFSRASLIAYAASILILSILAPNRKQLTTTLFSFALSLLLLFPQIHERGGITNYNSLAEGSDSIRIYNQTIAFKIMQDAPLLGLGYGQFSERASPYFPENAPIEAKQTAPHNIFLLLACETGLLSLLTFLYFLFSLFSFQTKESRILSVFFLSLLFIGCCDFYFLLFHQGRLLFFLFAALLALHKEKKKERNLGLQRTTVL